MPCPVVRNTSCFSLNTKVQLPKSLPEFLFDLNPVVLTERIEKGIEIVIIAYARETAAI